MLEKNNVKNSYRKSQIFRFIACLTMISNAVFFIIIKGYFSYLKESIKYLTFWGHNFEMMFFMLLIRKTHELENMKTKDFELDMQKSFMAHLQSTVLGMQFLITFFYWIVLFNKNDERSKLQWYQDIYMHSIPLIIMIIEMFLNTMKIRMKHLKLTIMLITWYGFVNIIITFITGTPIYPLLDYQDVKSIIFLVGALMTSIFGVIFFKNVQNLKLKFVNYHENKLRND